MSKKIIIVLLLCAGYVNVHAQTGVAMGGCKIWQEGKGWVEVPCNTSGGSVSAPAGGTRSDLQLQLVQSAVPILMQLFARDPKKQQAMLEAQQRELERVAIENENQRQIKEALAQSLHDKLMTLYKKLPDYQEVGQKSLTGSDTKLELKSFDGDEGGYLYKGVDINSAPGNGPTEVEIQNVFAKVLISDSTYYQEQMSRLMKETDNAVVPLPPQPRTIHEGIMLGLMNTQEINLVKQVKSPFTGKPYNDSSFFATSNDAAAASELLRGAVDNGYFGEYTLNTEWGKQLIQKLQGVHFDRLIAHSNGATVAEALIRRGVITVDELNVIGGDRSLINKYGFNELIATGKVKKVVVWYNPGDVIPYGTAAGLFSPAVTSSSHYINTAAHYFGLKLTGTGVGGDAGVEYRKLEGAQYTEGQKFVLSADPKLFFAAHGLDAYCTNMKKYFETH